MLSRRRVTIAILLTFGKGAKGASFGDREDKTSDLFDLQQQIAALQSKVAKLTNDKAGQGKGILAQAQGNTGGIVAISAIEKDVVEQSTKPNRYLTCDDIKKLEIVRTISSGMNKIVFEVKLPGSGASAVAKRCFKSNPRLQRSFGKETKFLKGLQEQYGKENTLGYFGECYASSNKLFGQMLKEGIKMDHILRNFSVGYTSVVEMGTPLLLNGQLLKGKGHTCSLPSRNCFAEYFTESDVEDLKMMARLYANYSKGPITLRKRKHTDNCKAEQYVATTTGLRHVDLEMAYLRKRSELTYSESLEINCAVLRILVNNKTLDCTTAIPIGKQQMNRRINTTAAVEHCSLPPEIGSEQHSGRKKNLLGQVV
jgi:hypothetical protein